MRGPGKSNAALSARAALPSRRTVGTRCTAHHRKAEVNLGKDLLTAIREEHFLDINIMHLRIVPGCLNLISSLNISCPSDEEFLLMADSVPVIMHDAARRSPVAKCYRYTMYTKRVILLWTMRKRYVYIIYRRTI